MPPHPPVDPLAALVADLPAQEAGAQLVGLLVLLHTLRRQGRLAGDLRHLREVHEVTRALGLPMPAVPPEWAARVLDRDLDLADCPFSRVGQLHERSAGSDAHRRRGGRFYTPPEVADLLVAQVWPALSAAPRPPCVADLAAGSGELLAAALRRLAHLPAGEVIGRMVAVDLDPVALQLTHLHLVYTAARAGAALPLPAPRLVLGDTLRLDLTALGPLDVVLGNPPFSDHPSWLREHPDLPGDLGLLRPHNNRATAFLLRALALPIQRFGFIMPNQLWSAPGEAAARAHIAKTASLTWILNNRGARLFDDIGVQPGMVVGVRGPAAGLTVTTLTDGDAPLTDLLARAEVQHIPCPTDDRWLPDPLAGRADLRPASAVHGLQRAPMPGNGPLADCWRVVREGPDRWRHALSGLELSPAEAAVALPRMTPDLLDPACALDPTLPDDERLLLPTALPPAVRTDLRQRAARLLREADEATMYAWYQRLAADEVTWFRTSGFAPGRPFVLWSRLATLTPGRECVRGAVFSGRSAIVPAAGNVSWVDSAAMGLALLAVWNSGPVFEQLRRFAPSRHRTTAELTGGLTQRVRLPPIDGLVERLRGVEGIGLGELWELGERVW